MPSTPNYHWRSRASDSTNRIAHAIDRFVNQVRTFWQRVTEGIAIQELWGQFQAEARASYELYSKEVDWAVLEGEPGWKRLWRITRALFWAMIMKLSPARRVFMLIALVFVFLGLIDLRVNIGEKEFVIGGGEVPLLLAAGSLLVLLALELADRVTMKRDLEIAREIQRWLVPEAAPNVVGVEIALATSPANTVAGDYYDAFLRPASDGQPGACPVVTPARDRLLVVVADVAGKSVPAALLMATFQASLRTLGGAPTSLLELVTGLNRYACAHSLGGRRFTTAFLAELDRATWTLAYVNAGHNWPILRRASGSLERLEAGGLPLGILSEARYDSGYTGLGPGDTLIIFTDGVVEARNEREEEYGEPRLLEFLRSAPRGSAADELKRLMASVGAFVGHARQHDDMTYLILRRK